MAADGEPLEDLETTETPEGRVPSEETLSELEAEFPLVVSQFRPAGDWLPSGIRNDGDWRYFRLQSESVPGGPPLLSFEGAAPGETEAVTVTAPRDVNYHRSGIIYYPALPVDVRGHPGVYLHQGLDKAATTVYPMCTLIWSEKDIVYSLVGVCDSHPDGRYDLHSLLLGANQISPTPIPLGE
jgi:hypothetical protein